MNKSSNYINDESQYHKKNLSACTLLSLEWNAGKAVVRPYWAKRSSSNQREPPFGLT
jgi:hypothetical protein